MKRTSLILIAVFALVMLPAAFAQSTTPSQDPSQQPSAQPSPGTPSSTQTPDSQSPSSSSQPSSSTSSGSSQNSFVGSIAKDSSGKYVLHAGAADYQLDDQSQAKKFDGKAVKVTGQLDQSSNTIRVQAIEPASSM
jgi:uncharacterized protein YdeI (BOF family)